jgi:arabinofuranan 3-O-arabinosyltransferase
MSNLLTPLRDGVWLTPERMKRWAVVFAGVWLFRLAMDVWIHTRFGVVDAHGEQLGRDFVNYWAGARLALHGRADVAYRIGDFLAYERSLTAADAELKWYGYPPVAMLLAAPFGLPPFLPALALWTLGGWAVLTRMLAPRMGWVMAAVALAATPAFFLNAISGQNGAFSAILLAGGVMLLDRRPLLAGLLFGLLCYKPHLGVLIPVALIAGGRWRTVLAAGATVVALVAASIAYVGWQPWADFVHNAPVHRWILETQSLNWRRMPSVYPALRMLGAPSGWAYAVQALSGLAAALAVVLVWRGRASTPLKGAALVVATFLATPYAWDYDMIVLLFAAAWFWGEAEAAGWRPWEKTTLALMVASPGAVALCGRPLLGPMALWTAVVLGLLVARTRLAQAPAGEGLAGEGLAGFAASGGAAAGRGAVQAR